MTNIHVVPQDGRWAVTEEGGSALSEFATQDEAWREGRQMAKDRRTEALLHAEDGQIRERSTYGHDPRDIPG